MIAHSINVKTLRYFTATQSQKTIICIPIKYIYEIYISIILISFSNYPNFTQEFCIKSANLSIIYKRMLLSYL